jgi:hypothetical protein
MVRALDKCRAKRRAVVECLRRGRDEARLAEVGDAHASSTPFLFPLSRLLRVPGGGKRFQRGILGLIAGVIRRPNSLEAQAAAAFPRACLSPHCKSPEALTPPSSFHTATCRPPSSSSARWSFPEVNHNAVPLLQALSPCALPHAQATNGKTPGHSFCRFVET